MKAEDIDFIVSNYRKDKSRIQEEIHNELSEDEAIQIYNELVQVLANHNVSYRCALNISISLMYAFMTGAAELHDED